MSLILRRLESKDESAFIKARDSIKDTLPNFAFYYEKGMSWEKHLQRLKDSEKGVGIPHNHVANTYLCAFMESEIVGRCSIRHRLTDSLRNIGGNIGFAVIPEHRRRGYATEILKQSLSFAQEIGLKRVLVTCDEGNIGSQKAIENNHGNFESLYNGPDVEIPKRRYWINIDALKR